MLLIALKIGISAILLVLVSEIGKRSGYLGGLILSLPVTSILALAWLWADTRDSAKVAALSLQTAGFVLPSLPFFISLWFLLDKKSLSFPMALGASLIIGMASYAAYYVGIDLVMARTIGKS